MKRRPYSRNPYKALLIQLIRGAGVDLETLWAAYRSLPPDDRDARNRDRADGTVYLYEVAFAHFKEFVESLHRQVHADMSSH